MKKIALVVLADGFEEIEAVTVIDVLRRSGCEVKVMGVGKRNIRGAHNVLIEADAILGDQKILPDAIVLPGGMPGSENLGLSAEVTRLLKKMHESGKLIGAICAAPGCVLARYGILDGKKATCYPGFEKLFKPQTVFSEENVVKDGHVITSRGPGSAMEFACALAEELTGKESVTSLKKGMLASF